MIRPTKTCSEYPFPARDNLRFPSKKYLLDLRPVEQIHFPRVMSTYFQTLCYTLCMLMHGRPTRNESGQAIVEYVLLLVFVVAIIGGILYQFNDAFRLYSNAWFVGQESYLACIIKNGILPDGESDASVDCTKPKFDLASGKPIIKDGGGLGASPNDPTKSPKAKDTKISIANTGTSSGDRGSSSGSSYVPFSKSDSKKLGGGPVGKDGGSKASTGNNGVSSINVTGNQDGEGGRNSDGLSYYGGTKYKGTEDSSRERTATSVPVTTRDMKSTRELAAEKAKKKAKGGDDSGMDFSFSNIVKLLIIVALIFGIIFFVGSQVLAVSRSKNRK